MRITSLAQKAYLTAAGILVCASTALGGPATVPTSRPTSRPVNREAEKFVRDCVESDIEVDLRDHFHNADERVISARLIRDLLATKSGLPLYRRVRIHGAEIDDDLDLSDSEIRAEFWLDDSHLCGRVDFSGCDTSRWFSMEGTTFEKSSSFALMHAHSGVQIRASHFNNDVDFSETRIDGDLNAEGCDFRGKANFFGAKIGVDANFNAADFRGAAEFGGIETGHDLDFGPAGMELLNVRHDEGLAVPLASPAATSRPVHNGAIFHNTHEPAFFINIKVGRNALFPKARFCGPAQFAEADIADQFIVSGASFDDATPDENQDQNFGANFNSAKIGTTFFLENAEFAGNAVFSFVECKINFQANDARFSLPANTIATFDGMHIGHYAQFARTYFAGQVIFSNAALNTFQIDASSWNGKTSEPEVIGLAFQHFVAAPPAAIPGPALLQFANRTAFDAEFYMRVETYLKSTGRPDDANCAFQARKKRERQSILYYESTAKWLWSWFLFITIKYGRAPWRALLASAVIIAIGAFVFRAKKMQVQKDKDVSPNDYSSIWYSLDVFAPVINLESANRFEPQRKYLGVWVFLRVERILGWILVPLGIAAVTGLLNVAGS